MNNDYSIEKLPYEIISKIISFFDKPCYCKKNFFKNVFFLNKYFFNLFENDINKIKKTCVKIQFNSMHKAGFSNKYNFCKKHEKKIINYYCALKNNNINNFIDKIIESDKKKCIDYGYFFNTTLDKLENNTKEDFFHFSSIEEGDQNIDIFKNHFKNIFTFGHRCCNGRGIQIKYSNNF
tara:strand:- start:338 stop:874 length:537 start_codon:yes stop_codon:yes gene_type:complete